ncbi:Hypothetical predicted protein, partial [Paramuricea clavata]
QSMSVMDELSHADMQIGKHDSNATTNTEAENFESETLQAIERAEGAINEFLQVKSKQASEPGDKTRFVDFWGLFSSLVVSGNEAANIKMARLRQSLKGTALEAIRGLGVSSPEYEEAKEILKTKFGGRRRQLQAYMDQLEALPSLKGSDVQGFERFANLVRITVVKLQAEGRDGELGEGTLHVLSLKDWLKEEVRVRVEAVEMVHGVEGIDLSLKRNEAGGGKFRYGDRGRSRTLFAGRGGVGGKDVKPPCALCEGNHVKRPEDKNPVVPREGETDSRTHTTMHDTPATEALSLRTIPVWSKANNRKVKVNALFDDASNETFLNAEVAGVLEFKNHCRQSK